MLHTVPMFFYNWLLYHRHDRDYDCDEEQEQEQDNPQRKEIGRIEHHKLLHKPLYNADADAAVASVSLDSSQDESVSFETVDAEPQQQQPYDHDTSLYLRGKQEEVREESDSSVLSTSSERIRFLQNQIHQYLSMAMEESNSEFMCQEDHGIPPMPKIPFVSIDVRTPLEETEHSEYDDEDEPDKDDEYYNVRRLLSQWERERETDKAACSKNKRGVWKETSPFQGESTLSSFTFTKDEAREECELSDASLEADDLVPLQDKDLQSIATRDSQPIYGESSSSTIISTDQLCYYKETKPQSFLVDFLSLQHPTGPSTTAQLNLEGEDSENDYANNKKNHHKDTTTASGSSLPLRQLLERVQARQEQRRRVEQELERYPLFVSATSAAHESQPAPTAASTPYHHYTQWTPERQRHHRHATLIRCPFPSHISVPMTPETSDTENELQSGPLEEHDSNGDEEEEEMLGNSDEEILDPTDPLEFGKMDYSPYLQHVSTCMNHFLMQMEKTCLFQDPQALEWMGMHPMVCQVKYHFSNLEDSHCLPLQFFSQAGCLSSARTAYQAYPEAIGMETPHVGLPLHFACQNRYHKDNYHVIAFLVNKFPDAVRFTNQEYHQTPLHLACQSKHCSLETIQILLEHYPTASQLADAQGFTPLHYACQYRLPLEILKALQASGPAVIGASTKTWQKPLHIALLHGCDLPTLQWLLRSDKRAAACTLDDFSTPLHCAVRGFQQSHGNKDKNETQQDELAKFRLLCEAHPDSLDWTNADDQTLHDLAVALGLKSEPVLQILCKRVSCSCEN